MTATIRTAYAALGRFPLSLLELAFRIGVGMVFFKSSLTKLDDAWMISDSAVALFQDEYKVPILPPGVAATLGTAVEFFGSLMIMAGFGARLAAAALLGLTAVIQFAVYPGNWAEHLLWAGLLAYILTRGPGPISIDHLIARRA
ncbi:MAG: DoxX family protein [Alphaproteobacteria bacterium]|nr:DoxX family protein [Alphaproteobacteria bacterium]